MVLTLIKTQLKKSAKQTPECHFVFQRITDLAGDGNHYSAEVIDESFKNMNRVQQQRAVYAALKGKMDGSNGELHALALTTKAPSDS